MQGLMMKHELMISDLIEHAAVVHKDREIYTLNTDMTEHRYTWADCAVRTRKLANALLAARRPRARSGVNGLLAARGYRAIHS